MKNSDNSCPKVFLSGFIFFVFLFFHAFSVFSENEPNNSIDTANPINVNSSIFGSFSLEDNSPDNFKLMTAVDGKLTIQVTADAGLCVSLTVLSETGLYSLYNNGSCGYDSYSNTITIENLAAGTYYIEATNYGFGNYTISNALEEASLPNDAELNDDMGTAINFSLNSEMAGHLGYRKVNTDYYDYYKITTSTDGQLSIQVSPDQTLCIDLTILNETGLYSLYNNGYCANSSHSNSIVINNLAAGTYYIATSAVGYGFYQISNSFVSALLANDIEPNDHLSEATVLPLNSGVTGHLGYRNVQNDESDFYQINTLTNGKLKITVIPDPTLCINLTLISGDGAYNLYNNGYCGNDYHLDSLVIASLPAGSYYLQAEAEGYGSYRLNATLGFALGISNPDQHVFSVFPNPAKDKLFLTGDFLVDSRFSIYDLAGKIVRSGQLKSGDQPYQVDLTGLKKGMYFFELTRGNRLDKEKFSVE